MGLNFLQMGLESIGVEHLEGFNHAYLISVQKLDNLLGCCMASTFKTSNLIVADSFSDIKKGYIIYNKG